MIHGLEISKDLEIKKLKVYSDSQLIINKMKNEFQKKGEKMSLYVDKARSLTQKFESSEITQIPRAMNEEDDALAKPATQGSTSDSTPVIQVHDSSIMKGFQVNQIDEKESWKTPVIQYLKKWHPPRRQRRSLEP